ncbi:integrase core domain-containing protein [Serratia sp. 1D1416]|uniref:integrase core domain-containing protein n=1 Tax=Serratia sp. 1D1416 TaxID=2447890 RepID=UPI001013C764|nr:integrase core domain-containing protein [Serratia sp. 1D1416]
MSDDLFFQEKKGRKLYFTPVLNKGKRSRKMVRESIEIYNRERPHQSLKYKTPDAVHQAFYRHKSVNLCQD